MEQTWLTRHTKAATVNSDSLVVFDKIMGTFEDSVRKISTTSSIPELSVDEAGKVTTFGDLSVEAQSGYRVFSSGKILFLASSNLISFLAGLRLGMPRTQSQKKGEETSTKGRPLTISTLELNLADPAIKSIADAWLSAFNQSYGGTASAHGNVSDIGWGVGPTPEFSNENDQVLLSRFFFCHPENIFLIAIKADVLFQNQTKKVSKSAEIRDAMSSDRRNILMDIKIPVEMIIWSSKEDIGFLEELVPGKIIPLAAENRDQVSATIFSNGGHSLLFTASLGRMYQYKAIKSSGCLSESLDTATFENALK